jgi:beta-lactamase regulating signal transducer with metallopeptidase domain
MSSAFMSALDLLIRVTVLLGAGAVAALLLHRRAASLRHAVWSASLGGSLLLAVLVPWSPRIDVPVWRRSVPAIAATSSPGLTPSLAPSLTPGLTPGLTPTRATVDLPPFWVLLWGGVTLSILAWSLFGRVGLALLVRRSRRIDAGRWRDLVDDRSARMGVRRSIAIYESDKAGAPMTWGDRRPVLLVPAEASDWSDSLRCSVAGHEVAHIARRDYLSQLMATVACAVYWFHPLAWYVARRMRQAAERACDDEVLALGTTGDEYAAHLIGVARVSHQLRLTGVVAIGMARPSTLEGRIVAVLDSTRARGRTTTTARVMTGMVAASTLMLVATVQPVSATASELATERRDSGATLEHAATVVPVPERSVTVNPATKYPVIAEPGPTKLSTEPAAPPMLVESQGGDSTFERTFGSARGGTLTLDLNTGGGVTVRGWDDDQVRVRAMLAGPDWRDVDVEIDREDNGVRVETRFLRRRGNHSTSNHFEIMVPRRYNVRLSSAGGSLTLIGLEGRFTGHTGGGELTLDRLTGSANLTTGGGEIDARDSDLSGSVSTGGGTVRLSNISGGLRGSSGSGPVVYGRSERSGRATTDISSVEVSGGGSRVRMGSDADDRAGKLFIHKAGGNVDLDAAPNGAVVRTGGGRVRIGRGAGGVEATTGGGDVTIGPIAGAVYATTGAGEVRVIVDKVSWTQVVEASSGKGRIIIELPRDFDGILDLETAHTRTHEQTARIESDWELEREPLTDWQNVYGTPRRFLRARAVLGRGTGRVTVRTVNGEIEIRRR